MEHWNNALEIIDYSNNYGGCSELGEEKVIHEIQSLVELCKTINVTKELQENLIDIMLDDNIYSNSGFTDLLLDSLLEICQSKDSKEYLAEGLSEINDKYYKKLAASIFLEIGFDEDYLRISKENLEYASDYLDLANYYNEVGEKEAALEKAWEGLDKGKGTLNEIYSYLFNEYKDDKKMLMKIHKIAKDKNKDMGTITQLLYDFYKEENDYPNQKKMLLEIFKYCRNSELSKWYSINKKELKQVDWEEIEPKIFSLIKNRSTVEYLKLCLEKGYTSEVLDYLKKQPKLITWEHLDVDHRFSRPLSETMPDAVLELYWEEVNAYMNMKKEKFYQKAVLVLKEIRTIMFNNNQHNEWVREFEAYKAEHIRKKLFIKMIEQNKLP